MNDNLLIVMCPPYPEYKTPPEDHSESELRDCPKCKSKMWLSQKKKGVLMFYACLNKDIFLACYSCVKNYIAKNPPNELAKLEI